LPEKDLPKGCPTCPRSQTIQAYKQEMERESIRRFKTLTVGWSLTEIIDLHDYLEQRLAGSRNRIPREWTTTLVRLGEIILSEQSHARWVDAYNAWIESKRN